MNEWGWARGWGMLAGAAILGYLGTALLYLLFHAVGRRVPRLLMLEGALLRRSRAPVLLMVPLIAVRVACVPAGRYLDRPLLELVERGMEIGLVIAGCWLAMSATFSMDEVAARRYSIEASDNLRARQIRTRVGLVRRIAVVGIAVVGLGILLLQTPGFRTVGTGLLASAGVLGVIVGVAAQRPIANLLAGVQIAITQPIRVEDAVIVEGEWGWVEEITLTYVVIRLWDLRRLMLPISYFLEKPFQNWTRTSASLRCVVFLYTDYSAPVDELRAELERVVAASPRWDGTPCILQVTELGDNAMQLRALTGAANSGDAWDLQCEIREKLIGFLQRNHPAALPRLRLASEAPPDR